ncbi:restriction endonuclease [Paraclostridium sordellii]|uniref:Restriction endonuclease n=1 Tax=Paraclostridium sordellii TaxID=1505 RepID=A0A9P1PCV1_PARSO|nr:restriction endonuclease [Paeniclostridium sordellii]CEO35930.1 restriction endonuclease [[Clostridium] sordellii] [Paeniclostridium sordellii]
MFKYKYDELINPCFQAIKNLGGSAKNDEINEKLISMLSLQDSEINDIHRNSTTKLEYRSAWARTYLKNAGYIENSSRGVWSITELGNRVDKVDNNSVKIEARAKMNNKNENIEVDTEENDIEAYNWQDEILDIVKKINPEKFEKLCQRLLRELGFVNVEVTGKSHDGGIDGKGILRLGGVLSFHVAFQAKRYNGTVPSSVIRDFRGAIMGRVDKGVIITTGVFSREATKEAIRDGATPIDLIDGNELASHLKNLGLGVEVKLVEKVIVKNIWFENI